jgi:hypothetical protein
MAKMEQGLPIAEANAARAELIMLHILGDLDQVIRDLLKFCKRPGPEDDQLPNLRSALRIGRGRSTQDVKLFKQRQAAIALWIQSYLDMQNYHSLKSPRKRSKTKFYKSERAIGSEVAAALNIGLRTVLRYWAQFKQQEPHQGKWTSEIAMRARVSDGKKEPRQPAKRKTKEEQR